MKKIITKIFIYLIILISFICVYLTINYNNFKTKSIIKQEKIIEIKDQDTFWNLWNKFKWINPLFLKIYLKYNKPDFILQKWLYKIKKDSNITQIISSLKKPIINQTKITILEWWNIYDIDEYLLNKWLINNKNDYIKYTTNKEKIISLTKFFSFIKDKDSLEWFLYPDTYLVKTDFKINDFVIQQLENFEKKVYKTLLQEKWYSISTIYDIINFASIVEKEEKNKKNKQIVAWILKKRLRQWWMLWADITVCYPYKLTSEECKLVVSKYINKKNSYNTRTMVWLPKTPIWNPSYDTIYFTINDKQTDYYYYLHNIKTWEIYYWKTNLEHERNKTLYLWK